MKKILKVLAILFLIIVLFLFFAPMMFKGKIKELITSQAGEYLNAKLEFADLDLSLIRSFPALSVRIDELSLSGINEFEKDTLVSFNYFQTDLNLMSVAFGDAIEIKAIILNEPKVLAKVQEDGKANWDIAKEDTTVVEEVDTTESDSKFKISLKKFEIINAHIVYDDADGDIYAAIDSLDFYLKGDMTQDHTTLNILTTIKQLTTTYEGITYLKKVSVGFKSDIDADMANSIFKFKENEFSLNEIVLGFDGKVEMPKDDIDIDIDFKTGETAFKPVLSLIPAVYMTDFAGIKTSGQFDLSGYVKGVYNDDNLPAFGIKLLVENGRFQYPDLPQSVENINVDIQVDNKGGSGDDNIIDIKKAHIEMAQNPFDANMKIITTADDVDMDGKVAGKIDFGSLTDIMPLEDMTIKGILDADLDFGGKLSALEAEKYDEFKAEGKMELTKFNYESSDMPEIVNIPSALMEFTPNFVSLNNLDINIGKTDLHLNGKIDNLLPYVFQDSTLMGQFNFTSKYFNANDLIAESEEEQVVEETDTVPLTAVQIPGNIDFLLRSKMDKVIYDNIEITKLSGDIILRNSKMVFKGVDMNLLGGNMKMDGYYDSKDTLNPKVSYQMKIKDFNIPAAFDAFNTVQQLAPVAKNANGQFSLDFGFSSDLDYYLSPVYNTLNGKGGFLSEYIKLTGVETFTKLANLIKWPKISNPALKNIDLKFQIKDGNIKVDPTKMQLGKSEIEFGGTQGLDKKLDYDLKLNIPSKELGASVNNVVNNLVSKTGKEVDIAGNIPIGAKIVGTVDDPKVKLAGSKDGGVKEEIKEEIGEEAKKLIGDADEKVKKIIADAEKEADKIRAEAKKAGEKLVTEADKQGDKLKLEADNKGKQLIAEADKKAQKLVDEAKNPIAKIAAKKSGELLKKEAQKTADKLNAEADKKAQRLHDEAQLKADELDAEADKKANLVIDNAKTKAENLKEKGEGKADNL
ncbi:MAG: AsmA-like C-terminal region-containing protein [Bacteroidota bacterium]